MYDDPQMAVAMFSVEAHAEIKRLDALLLKQKEQELAFESQQCTSSTPSPPPGQQQHYSSLTSIPDEWIDQLSSPTTGAAAQQDDDLAFESSSSSSSSCWDWCIKSGPSSWPPHVDLEPFTGEAKDWPKFIQRFKILIQHGAGFAPYFFSICKIKRL